MPPGAFPGLPEHKGLADRIKTLEAKVARLARARTMQSTSLDGGTFRIKGDGSIQFVADDGTVILKIDKAAFTFDRADGSRQLEITPAGGVKIYESDGATVAASLDSGGIANQILVEASQTILTETEFTTTSFADAIDADITIPAAWNQYTITAWFVGTYSDTGGVSTSLQMRARYNSSAGDTRTFGRPDPVERRYPISHLEQWAGESATGSRKLDVQAALANQPGGAAMGVQNAKLLVKAERTG